MKTYIHVYLQQVLILVLPFVPMKPKKKKKMQLAKYGGLLSINMLYQNIPYKQWKFLSKKGKK